jgi:HEAT repeat protein
MYAKDSEMRSTAATMVCKFGYGPSAVKALIATLDHEDLRCTAIFGLGHLGDVSAVEPLISFARNDKNTNIRRTAIDSLGEIGDEAATDTLIEIVQKEKDEELRDRAAWALGEIRSGKAVVTLIATIQNDRSTDVRRSAAWALGQIGDDRAAETLIEAIENNRCGVRGSFSAVRALGKIQGERAIQALIAIVNCGKPDKIGDRRAVEVLIGALTDYDSKLQLEAVRALNKIGDERAVVPLIEIVKRTKFAAMDQFELSADQICYDICERAVYGLGKFGDGDERAVMTIIELLKSKDAYIRSGAAITLGNIGDDRATLPLKSMLKDNKEEVRKAADSAIRKISEI